MSGIYKGRWVTEIELSQPVRLKVLSAVLDLPPIFTYKIGITLRNSSILNCHERRSICPNYVNYA